MPSHEPTPFEVYVDGKLRDNLQVLQVSQSTMGAGDWAVLQSDRADSRGPEGAFLQDVELLDIFKQKAVEILIDLGGRKRVIHYGHVVGGTVRIDGDQVTFTSRLDSHLFGKQLDRAIEIQYPSGSSTIAVDRDRILINPIVDGKARPSMWQMPSTGSGSHNVFAFADSLPAGAFSTPTPTPSLPALKFWTLTDIVEYLIETLTPAAFPIVHGPGRRAIEAVLGTSTALLRDIELPRGRYLPELLDLLVEPFGFYWFVDYVAKGRRAIRFGIRGDDRNQVKLPRQRQGFRLDTFSSWVHDVAITVDHVQRSCNKVDVLGAFEEREVTVELVPAWKAVYDDLTSADLTTDSATFLANPELYDVHRKWVLNEGRDYTKVRTSPFDPFYAIARRPIDFAAIFGHGDSTNRRRRFYPTLTQSPDIAGTPLGQWRGVFVEFWDPTDAAWVPVSQLGAEGSIQVLKDECGIRFSNPIGPPNTLMQIGLANLKIRVTATIRSDRRIRGTAKAKFSNLNDELAVRIERGDFYRWASLQSSGVYKSRFYDSVHTASIPMTALEVDDRADIARLATTMVEAWNQSAIQGPIKLHGLWYKTNYLGKTVPEISTLKLGLYSNHRNITPAKYASVSEVVWDVENQEMRLMVSTHKPSRFREKASEGTVIERLSE